MKRNCLLLLAMLMLAATGLAQDKAALIARQVRAIATQHPAATLQDVYKSFYQDRYGPGHLLADTAAAKRYLERELETAGDMAGPLYEPTGWQHNFYRVSLAAVSRGLVGKQDYFDAFCRSTLQVPPFTASQWRDEWEQVVAQVSRQRPLPAGFAADSARLAALVQGEPRAVHHSRAYNEAYAPHYRIIAKDIFEQEILPKLMTEIFTTASGRTVTIGLIKHGSISLSYDGYEIQIDPVADYMRHTDYASMPKADAILVTHEHADHFSPATIETLTKPGTALYLNGRCHEQLQRGEVLRNGDVRELGRGIVLRAVPAYNTTPEHLKFHPRGVGNGYVLDIDGLRVYVAGDTEDIDEMAQLRDIDVAFLPVNQPYTMTVEQAARAATMIRPKVLIPYHFGSTDIERLPQLLQGSGIEVRLRAMQ